jgi:hypothetical protein
MNVPLLTFRRARLWPSARVVLLLALATPALAVDPTPPASAVRILHQAGRWTGTAGGDMLSDSTHSMFLISGALQNAGDRPLAYVKLRFELLDSDGVVLASEYGYNHGAEDLRRPGYEAGKVGRKALHLEPIAPGAVDMFRMLFVRGSMPAHFDHWRVRVLGAAYE